MKDYLIKKLGGYTEKEYQSCREKALKDYGKEIYSGNIHLPEYRNIKNGKLHLHQCPYHWEGNCVENKDNDYCNENVWLNKQKL